MNYIVFLDFGDGGGGGSARGDISPDKLDPLFADAARVVVLAQHGSTSLIQRKLEIGFNRAGKILDQLTDLGYIEAPLASESNTKPRKVLISIDQLDELFPDMEG